MGKNNQKGNLVLLCRYCHGETEGMEPENVLTYILTTEFVGPLGNMMNRLETACGFTEEKDSNEFEDYLGNVGLLNDCSSFLSLSCPCFWGG